jgi:hypothetical protein
MNVLNKRTLQLHQNISGDAVEQRGDCEFEREFPTVHH